MTCAQCRHTGGWLEDEATGKPVGRCPCMHRGASIGTPGPTSLAADAHPGDMKTALLVIHDAIQGRDTISANSIRYLMDIANVKNQVRGPAFARAVAEGLLEPIAQETSTGQSAHGKPVVTYRVLRRSA
jgi:hypothetical protein